VSWTATATSKAGVTTTVTGRFRLTDFYVARAPRVHGRYVVTVGKTYTVVAYLIRASFTTTMDRKYEYWTLGVLSGGHLHIILITLRR
jgi:hypothetical protein